MKFVLLFVKKLHFLPKNSKIFQKIYSFSLFTYTILIGKINNFGVNKLKTLKIGSSSVSINSDQQIIEPPTLYDQWRSQGEQCGVRSPRKRNYRARRGTASVLETYGCSLLHSFLQLRLTNDLLISHHFFRFLVSSDGDFIF